MELSSLKSQIKSGELQYFYIFTGPETEVMKIYLQQMSKATKSELCYLDNIVDLTQKINVNSLLQNAQICVLRDCKEFISDEATKALISTINTQKKHILILIYSALDKRTKFYKTYNEQIITFDYLKKEVLAKYIKKEIELSPLRIEKLIEFCENDYSRILLEIDKIKNYSKAQDVDVDTAFNKLLSEGVIYRPPDDVVFELVNAILTNRVKSFSLLEECYAYGEATLVILANLYNSTKQLLQVQSYEGDNLSKATGLTPFQIKLAKDKLNYNTDESLAYLLKLIREVEVGIKTGKIEETITMSYILVQFWS